LIAPESNPDHGEAMNWRSSSDPGGNPGTTEATAFAGNPDDDLDGDGMSAFLEHALGTSDAQPGDAGGNFFLAPGLEDNAIHYSFVKSGTADDVVYDIQHSLDLAGWTTVPAGFATLIDMQPEASGRVRETWQVELSPGTPQYFLRLFVSSRQ
jgi:hypothetical protein